MFTYLKNLIPQSLKNSYHYLIASVALIKFRHPSRELTIIGVTGTDGKTTTSTLIYHLLKSAGFKVALISTVAAYIGKDQINTGFHVTSPDPWQLQKLIRRIADQGYQYLVLEATSHGLDQHRFLGVDFNVGILTNITHEHLDYHHTYDHYTKAKLKLFRRTSIAVINQEDESFTPVRQQLSGRVEMIAYDHTTLTGSIKSAIATRFPEKYNQLNATAATLVASYLKIKDPVLIKAMATFPGIPGRMQFINNTRHINLVVDFAHTPNALKSALTALRPQTKGKLIAVFGCAGLRDHSKRPFMGKIASELADEIILTAEDPRTEDVYTIFNDIMSGVTTNHGHMHQQPDRQQAINFAVSLAKAGDTVGIFGKGHEQSMCYGTTETPWSDVKAAHLALKQS